MVPVSRNTRNGMGVDGIAVFYLHKLGNQYTEMYEALDEPITLIHGLPETANGCSYNIHYLKATCNTPPQSSFSSEDILSHDVDAGPALISLSSRGQRRHPCPADRYASPHHDCIVKRWVQRKGEYFVPRSAFELYFATRRNAGRTPVCHCNHVFGQVYSVLFCLTRTNLLNICGDSSKIPVT